VYVITSKKKKKLEQITERSQK